MKKPMLLLVMGLPGTGKSYLAKRIARKVGASILRTDEIRKELAGIHQNEHRHEDFGIGLYTEEMTQKTYKGMYERAKEILKKGDSCILDATFSKKTQREGAYEIAKELNTNYLIIECICPEEIVIKRMEERSKDQKAVSDATFRIYHGMKDVYEPLGDDEIHITVDTSKNLDENLRLVLREIK
ncbi:MAG: AAA family ATPase [Candidatus Altiarchaeota archaeon]|nr:AAA family ATPase [Candidatus Altiarchaeota archaeon]